MKLFIALSLESHELVWFNVEVMEAVLDLHLHSRFSRAVSPRMNLPNMHVWAQKKGIDVLTVADFTHPIWFREMRSQLIEATEGLYKLKQKPQESFEKEMLFFLSTELSCIYSGGGKARRIHNLILAPNIETVEKINKELLSRGFNLSSDGRPILGISSENLAELLFTIDENIMIIPCHVWTPWFALYGSKSGYDSIDDCFGKFSKNIYAVETGLSSDPSMNWRIKELKDRSIVSFSDAHSLEKMGREATIIKGEGELSYEEIISAFKRGKESRFKISYTIEFYPEEGKYHFTGHRLCNVSLSPEETRQKGVICPFCHRPLTVGVMHRIDELGEEDFENYTIHKNDLNVAWVLDRKKNHPPYVSLVPLLEVLAEALRATVSSGAVISSYDKLVAELGSEIEILLKVRASEIRKVAGDRVAEAVEKVRSRNISVKPGFDGEYGKVSIWEKEEDKKEITSTGGREGKTQLGLDF